MSWGALESGDLPRARLRVARIVGRDTDELGEEEIWCALAESLADGVVAPLFYLAVGGVPLAMAYKAINTLDSMIGHKDEKYLYFGRVAARVDDVANFIPARIAALLPCVTAEFLPQTSGVRAGHIWLRDRTKHASPNAGQVEAAMAGLLGVRLGGTKKYAGEVIASPHLGSEFPLPNRNDARRAWKAVGLASLLGFGGALLLTMRKNMSEDFLPAHGGQLCELAAAFGVPEASLLDFSASIHPHPPSDLVVDTLCDALRARTILIAYRRPHSRRGVDN